jgi:hypothetical protein
MGITAMVQRETQISLPPSLVAGGDGFHAGLGHIAAFADHGRLSLFLKP